jgi:hypothetical protein
VAAAVLVVAGAVAAPNENAGVVVSAAAVAPPANAGGEGDAAEAAAGLPKENTV